MNRRTLIILHGFIAVFFLPLAMLYAVTGALYILGSNGTSHDTTITVELTDGWPESIDAARELAGGRLLEAGLPEANPVAGEYVFDDDRYYWRALTHGVTLARISDDRAELRIQENSFYRQLVEIHKNHAGPWFRILGIAFGLAMLILILSGAWMMFASSMYRRTAGKLFAGGLVVSLAAYVATVLG